VLIPKEENKKSWQILNIVNINYMKFLLEVSNFTKLDSSARVSLYPKTTAIIDGVKLLAFTFLLGYTCNSWIEKYKKITLQERQLTVILHNWIVRAKIWNCITQRRKGPDVIVDIDNMNIIYKCSDYSVVTKVFLTEEQITGMYFPVGTQLHRGDSVESIKKIPSE